MSKKIRVGLFFGGNSSEHDVSKRSAKNYYDALSPNKYEVLPILISKKGVMINTELSKQILFGADEDKILQKVTFSKDLFYSIDAIKNLKLDLFFPSVHGNLGEDGTLAGFFRLLKKPFVGSGLRAHADSFDKVVTKELMTANNIQNTKFLVILQSDKNKPSWKLVKQKLGKEVFVKAANQGSSVGMSKVSNEKEYLKALKDSFQYDEKIIVEESVEQPTELEIGLIGNNKIITSPIGAHWVPGQKEGKSWFDYKNKFIDNTHVIYQIPARISKEKEIEVKKMSLKAYKILGVKGFARIDFLMDKNKKIYLNEFNTLPGNTNMSLFPVLFEKAGMSRSEQADRLVNLAFEEFNRQQNISYSFVGLGSEKISQKGL